MLSARAEAYAGKSWELSKPRQDYLSVSFSGVDAVNHFFGVASLENEEAGLRVDEVSVELAAALSATRYIGQARATHELLSQEHSGLAALMQNNSHPERSGDIYVAQAPYWFMFEKGAIAAMHGPPWSYDTHVPIIFAGKGIKGKKVDRRVHPVDVAPTLSALLGLVPPAGSEVAVLQEVLQ